MLERMFTPSRVAVVGATERQGSVGAAVTRNLLATFDGDVVPVNPNTDEIFGHEAVDSVGDVAGIDLVVIAVPSDVALDVLRECGANGISNVIVLSAGFSEVGGRGGQRERTLVHLAEEHGLNVVGPNSLGIMSTTSGLNASFGPEQPLQGGLSFLSQSGAFITAVVDWATGRGIGFKDIVSLGNKAVLDESDFLDVWNQDGGTEVIVGYLEGIENGRRFIDTARRVTPATPVVLMKAGRTDAGARAASSHTGAMAGSDRAHTAALQQAGVLRATSVQGLFDVAQTLDGQPLAENDTVAIVTNAGGPGVIATDAVGESSLTMASFMAETHRTLAEALPEDANVNNPIDALGDATAERFGDALGAVVTDENVGAALVIAAPTAVLEYEELAETVLAAQDQSEIPVSACLMGGERVQGAQASLEEAGIPCWFDPKRAVDGLDALERYRRIHGRTWDDPTSFDVDRDLAESIIAAVRDRPGNRLGVEAMQLLEAYGIPIPEATIVDSAKEARQAAVDIGGPVAMKVVSPEVVQKTDIGGVVLEVAIEDVQDTYDEIITRTRNYQPDVTIRGVQVQEMVDVEAGVETIVGVNRDPQFGPLLLFGAGGIFVEVLEDTSLRVAPVSATEAESMVDEIRTSALLHGARGREPIAVDRVVETIQRLSQLATDLPAVLELDVNPLVALPDAIRALDIRLTIDPECL